MLNDAHCHFFSTPFFAPLGGDAASRRWVGGARDGGPAVGSLGGRTRSRRCLARGVDCERAGRTPVPCRRRFAGTSRSVRRLFHGRPDAARRQRHAAAAIDRDGMRTICLFPAMHRYSIQDDRRRRVFDVAAARPGTAVFVHCGVLSVGVRKKAWPAQPVRHPLRQSARSARHRSGAAARTPLRTPGRHRDELLRGIRPPAGEPAARPDARPSTGSNRVCASSSATPCTTCSSATSTSTRPKSSSSPTRPRGSMVWDEI